LIEVGRVQKIIIVGDSHSNALKAAQASWANTGLPPLHVGRLGPSRLFRNPIVERAGTRVTFSDPGFHSRFRELTGLDAIAPDPTMLWGFAMGFGQRVHKESAWERAAPADLAIPRRQPITSGMMSEMFRHELRHIMSAFEEMKAIGLRFFVVAAPPPRGGDSAWRQDPEREAVRLTVYRRFCSHIRSELESRGVVYVLPPGPVLDEDGLLKPEYSRQRESDDAHGNELYGERMLAHIADFIRREALVTEAAPAT
jgi:hypothetical protein